MLLRALLVLFAVGCTHSELVYTNLTGAGPAGEMVSRRFANGRRVVTFAYNDRGRGVQLSSEIDVNDRGIPQSIETRGVNYLKVPVAESHRQPSETDAFYASVNTVPEEYGLLANALLRRPDRRLPLAPSGEATLTDAGELAVDGRRLRLYFITGIDLLPLGVWLDENGEFFGTSGPTLVYTEIRTIRKGSEALAPRLRKFEEETRLRTEREIAKAVTHIPRSAVVFADVTVFDSRTAASVAHRNVVVEGNRIVSVAPSTSDVPRGATIIRGEGKTLMPGLWDVHAHNADEHGTSLNGLYQILCGVTSIRDLGGGSPEQMVEFRRAYDAGELVGPRVVLSGMIDSPGPLQGPTPVLVDTVEELRAAIDRYVAQGFEQIKFYSSFRPELIDPAIEYARSKGVPVTGHIPAATTARDVVEGGLSGIHHINFLFLNFWPEVKDTNTPRRFSVPAERATELDLGSKEVRDLLSLLAERRVAVDPTLSIFEFIFTSFPGEIPPAFRHLYPRLPPRVQQFLVAGQGLTNDAGKREHFRRSFSAFLAMTRAAHERGVPILAGSDSLAGFVLHRELELLAAAGIPAAEVLRIATLTAAKEHRRDDVGVIAAGKLADLVLVDGDPVRDISAVRNIAVVMKDGKLFYPDELYRAVGLMPRP